MADTLGQQRIDIITKQIAAYEAAIDALLLGAAQSYSLNTGQTTQSVTKFDIEKLQNILNSLYAQYDVWVQRRDGSRSFNLVGY